MIFVILENNPDLKFFQEMNKKKSTEIVADFLIGY